MHMKINAIDDRMIQERADIVHSMILSAVPPITTMNSQHFPHFTRGLTKPINSYRNPGLRFQRWLGFSCENHIKSLAKKKARYYLYEIDKFVVCPIFPKWFPCISCTSDKAWCCLLVGASLPLVDVGVHTLVPRPPPGVISQSQGYLDTNGGFLN